MPISLEDLTTDQLLAHARQLQTSHDTMAAIAADPALRPLYRRDQTAVWLFAVGLPFAVTGLFKAFGHL
jgi:hypothetical protein